MKRPSFQFYPNDWLSASDVRACSVGARGLWIDMLCFMHQGDPYGHLTLNGKGILPPILARIVGASSDDVEGWLAELEAMAVFSRTADGTIYSRRMIRDEEVRQARAAGGVKSLNHPNVAKPKADKGAVKGYPSRIPFRPSPSSSSSSSSSSQEEGAGVLEETLSDALEAIFPGHAGNRRLIEELVLLAMRLKATSADIRSFPGWLAEVHPKKSFGPYAFKDLFDKSLKAKTATADPKFTCARCQDRGIVASPNGGRAIDCPNCSAQEAKDARRTA
jgi:hypothetical protein